MNRAPRIRLIGKLTSHSDIAISMPHADKGDMAPTKKHDGTLRFCIPGSTKRGAYRAAMNSVLHDYIRAGQHPALSYLNIARNSVGGVKGSKKGMLPPKLVMDLLDTNPIFDAMGGGEPVFAEGRIKVGDALSVENVTEPTVITGVRADPFRRNTELGAAPLMSDPENFSRILEINGEIRPWSIAAKSLESRKKAERESAIEKLEKATGLTGLKETDVAKKIAQLTAERMTLGGSDNSLLMPLPETKLIPQGEFTHRIDIEQAHLHTIGMFVEGLVSMARRNYRFGGLAAKGFGSMTAEYRVDVLDDLTWIEDCTIVINGEDAIFEIIPVSGKTVNETLIEQCRVAFREAFAEGKLDFTFRNFDDTDEDETELVLIAAPETANA